MPSSPPEYRAGADIGGTFTDLIVVDRESGRFHIGKTLTTPDDPSRAVAEVLGDTLEQAGLDAWRLGQVIHGTTLVTNAMIERKGALTALVTTEGFRDSIEIGREARYELYDLKLIKPEPLVPRYLRFGVPQRTCSDGSTHRPLDEANLESLGRELEERGVEAVAVVFLHSFTNPRDERRAREILRRVAPSLRVSISSDVVPEIREYERASTTIANVYVQELVETYLERLVERLVVMGFEGGLSLMLSSGGIATVETATRFPVRLLESGPAAGALAAAAAGKAAGRPDLISFDMGGTTAKICVIEDGEPRLAHDFEVDRVYRFAKGSGLPIRLPVLELIEIGTGGGSIARVDSLGLLKAGPDSASAVPGPACYGQGGELPTLTDANLLLGYLDPDYFLGGGLALDADAARRAVERHVAGPLGVSAIEAAWGIHQIANENMANAARVHALERGKDPRRFPLFAFGGAGPVHAYRIAQSLGCPALLAPLGAGVTSALGFLSAPLAFDFVRSQVRRLGEVDWGEADALFADMEAEGEALLGASGIGADEIRHRREVEMRYVGQGHEIRVEAPAGALGGAAGEALRRRFEKLYLELYERSGPPVPLEILSWRVTCSGPAPDLRLLIEPPSRGDGSADAARKGSRPAYFPEAEGFVDTAVYDRYLLAPGARFSGPAIVEERESTVIVGPGARCVIDERANLEITMPAAAAASERAEEARL